MTPFGGCEKSGFLTFAFGCSAWPEFLRGFMTISAIAAIAAHKKPLTAFGLVAVLLVVMAGGAALISTGEGAAYFEANFLVIAAHLSNPLLLGSFAALFIYVAITKFRASGGANVGSS